VETPAPKPIEESPKEEAKEEAETEAETSDSMVLESPTAVETEGDGSNTKPAAFAAPTLTASKKKKKKETAKPSFDDSSNYEEWVPPSGP